MRTRSILIATAVAVVLGLSVPLAFKAGVGIAAESRASSLENASPIPTSGENLAVELARRLNVAFDKNGRDNLLERIGRRLAHRFVPWPFRLDQNALDMAFLRGDCDSAARALIYLLSRHSIEAQQLNFVSPSAAHSATIAHIGDRTLLLDSFFGVVPRFFGKILSPLEAKHHAREGSIEWTSLSKSADKSFYQNFDHVRFARQGEPLVIESTVRLVATDDLTLGEADGNSADVGSSSSKFGLTPYWTYLGSRYDRAWVRVLNFPEDTIVRIKPVGPPEESLITTDVRPTIGSDGVLTYTMKAGQTLRFIDGRAGFDWFRLRSYQDVDYIVFEHAAHNSRPQGHF
jgi:hypothetical protein